MYKNRENYSEEKKGKKRLVAIGLLILALALIGFTTAYYSDLFFKESDIIQSGTLKIQGDYVFELNQTVTDIENITSVNPGDVIVVRGSIENKGTQSAWIRELITIKSSNSELLADFSVYEGEFTQAELLQGAGQDNAISLTAQGLAAGANKVISGSKEDPTGVGKGYDYLAATSYDFVITIYFSHNSGNATQGLSFEIKVATQALQFANNNSAPPNDEAWSSVNSVN